MKLRNEPQVYILDKTYKNPFPSEDMVTTTKCYVLIQKANKTILNISLKKGNRDCEKDILDSQSLLYLCCILTFDGPTKLGISKQDVPAL